MKKPNTQVQRGLSKAMLGGKPAVGPQRGGQYEVTRRPANDAACELLSIAI